MKLFFAPTSPFVRKCLICAAALKLQDRLELVSAKAHPVVRDVQVVQHNPLGKIPALLTDDGLTLYDSRVICEYLNSLVQGPLFPADGQARWQALSLQSLADGMMDACVLARYEDIVRPEELRWPTWKSSQLKKVSAGLRALETQADTLGQQPDIGNIAVACALWYLDLRYAEIDWRQSYPLLAQWYQGFSQQPAIAANWQTET